MNWELLAYLTLVGIIVGIIVVAGVMALKGFGGGFRDGGVIPGGGIVPASPSRSWHGPHYVDDTTGRVIGTVQGYDDVWQATGDLTAVFIDEASARRAVESDYTAKEALR